MLKRRNARALGSRALLEESNETLLCAYLSIALFRCIAVNASTGWSGADVVAALAMLPWIVIERADGLRSPR